VAIKKENYYQINSVVKLFNMLETMVDREEWELGSLTEKLDIPKATVMRMLLTLKSMGYVDQIEVGKRYYVTTRLFDIGSKAIRNIDVFKLSRPIMEDLLNKCDETVYLSVLSGIDVIVISKILSRHHLKVDSYVGDRIRSYLASGGKALLAALTPEERLRLFSGHTFEQMTEKSIASIEQLEAEMKKTNAQGYALADEERFKDIRSVGVPIFNHKNKPIAALSSVAPKVRLKMTDIPDFARKVVEAGNEISRKMGASRFIE
jgi:IclR family KDG regulon transcriptional repressor